MANDASTDDTEAIAKRCGGRILYTRKQNPGPAAVRNRGLQMSCWEVTGFLDVEDLWSENKLSLQLVDQWRTNHWKLF